MSIIDDVQEIVELVDKSRQVELYKKIVALELKILELERERRKAEALTNDLQEKLQFRQTLAFQNSVYYVEGDTIPYCPNCWEGAQKAIHLTVIRSSEDGRVYCQICKANYYLKEKPPKAYFGDEDEDRYSGGW